MTSIIGAISAAPDYRPGGASEHRRVALGEQSVRVGLPDPRVEEPRRLRLEVPAPRPACLRARGDGHRSGREEAEVLVVVPRVRIPGEAGRLRVVRPGV